MMSPPYYLAFDGFYKDTITNTWKINPKIDRNTINPLDGQIVSIQRRALLGLDGKKVEADLTPIHCFVLSGLDGAFFGIKIETKKAPHLFCIEITTLNSKQLVYIHPIEFVSRLYLDWDDLSPYIYRGELKEYLTNKKTVEILSNYSRILDKEEKNHSSQLSPLLLFKVIKAGFIFRQMRPWGGPLESHLSSKDPLNEALKRHQLIVSFRGNLIDLYELKAKTLISEGGQSQVYTILKIASKKHKILKLFKSDSATAKKEFQILHDLHKNFPKNEKGKSRIPGIQKPHYGIIFVDMQLGCPQSLFEGNLREALGWRRSDDSKPSGKDLFHSISEKINAIQIVLQGFHYCVEKKGLIHGDIKLENILFKHDLKTKKISLFLGDFGSAVLFDPLSPQNTISLTPWTAHYVPLEDCLMKNRLRETFEYDPTMENWQKYIYHAKKCDIFSLGLTLAELFVPDAKFFKHDVIGFPILNTFSRQPLENAKIDPKICDLIQSMVSSAIENRPTITEVLFKMGIEKFS